MNRTHNGTWVDALDALEVFIARRRATYEQVGRIVISDRYPGLDEPLRATSAGSVFVYEYNADRPDDPIRVVSVIGETAREVLRRPEFCKLAPLEFYQGRVQSHKHIRPIIGASLLRIVVNDQVTETIPQIGVQPLGPDSVSVGEERLRRGGYDLAAAFNSDEFKEWGLRPPKLGAPLVDFGIADIRTALAAWGEHHRSIFARGCVRESKALDRDTYGRGAMMLWVDVRFGTLDIARSFTPTRFVPTSMARSLDRLGLAGSAMDRINEGLASDSAKLQQMTWVILNGASRDDYAPVMTVVDLWMTGASSVEDYRVVERLALETLRESSAGWFDELKRACA